MTGGLGFAGLLFYPLFSFLIYLTYYSLPKAGVADTFAQPASAKERNSCKYGLAID